MSIDNWVNSRPQGGGQAPIRVEDKFWTMVDQTGDDPVQSCWNWTGGKRPTGYGVVSTPTINGVRGKSIQAHRWAYEYLRAEIPPGLHIGHLCNNTSCVNPWHMEPVTQAVNNQRRWARSPMTECRKGHPKVPENRYTFKDGSTACSPCARERARRNK